MTDLVGRVIRGYEIRQLLGRGGFGAVYRAFQPSVSRDVAVKVILPEFSADPDFVRGFEVEAQLVARLEHPHIVPLFDYWHDESGAFIVMRWLKGGSLADLLSAGAIPLDQIVRLLDQIAAGLTAAHRGGVVHRDLKPDNILLDDEGNAYLTDFGIAKPVGHNMTNDNVSGSIPYMAPEQLMGQSPSPAADIYSLGIMLYEMITGKHPFASQTPTEMMLKHLNDPLPELTNLPDELTSGIKQLLQTMTAKDPNKRHQNALAVAASFRELAISRSTLTTGYYVVPPILNPKTLPQITAPSPKQGEILQNRLDSLYVRLDHLYEKLKTEQNTGAIINLRNQVRQVQLEINYRANGLRHIEKYAALDLSAAMRPPSAPAHDLVNVGGVVGFIKARILSDKSVTLLGASGVGKSEIAALLARDSDVQFYFDQRIVWFPMGPTPDYLSLLGEWLLAVGVPQDKLATLTTPAQRKKQLIEALGSQRMLVIVDDLWKAEDLRQTLLNSRNQLTYIVTTRLAEVSADLLWEVIRLDALKPDNRALLLQRLVPELQTSDEIVQRLIQRVGGLPRDLVLMGTRLRRAGTSASRLRRELEKLAEHPTDALEQGYASLSLSVEALTDEARRAFRAFAVLAPEPNTFSEDAGEALCQNLRYLDELVDYSLLRVENERYSLHPSFSEYARKYLPLDEGVSLRIVKYYLQYAIDCANDFDLLTQESRNLETALTLAEDTANDPDALFVKSVEALNFYWVRRGFLHAGIRYHQAALQRPTTPKLTRINLLYNLSEFVKLNGESEQADDHIREALACLTDLTESSSLNPRLTELRALLLQQRADIKYRQRQIEIAKALCHEAIQAAKDLPQAQTTVISSAYNTLGTIAINIERDPQQAKQHYTQSMKAARNAGANADYSLCLALRNLGLLEGMYFREFKQARQYLAESLELARSLGQFDQISGILMNRGTIDLMQNHLEQARANFEEALEKARQSHAVEVIGWGLVTLANLEISFNEFTKAEGYLYESLSIAIKSENAYLINSVLDVFIKTGESRIVATQIGANEAWYQAALTAARKAQLPAAKLERFEDLIKRLSTSPYANPRQAISIAHLNLGLLEGGEFHDYAQAKYHLTESVKLAREADNAAVLTRGLLELLHAQCQLNDLSAALALVEELVQPGVLNASTIPRFADELQGLGDALQTTAASSEPCQALTQSLIEHIEAALAELEPDRRAALITQWQALIQPEKRPETSSS